MWRLLLGKVGMSLLTIGCFFVGMFGYGLILLPFNLPYLLKISADAEYYFMGIFALVFVCVATVMVRAKWCFETDLFFSSADTRLRSLFLRVVRSQEFVADLIVFALWDLVMITITGVRSQVPWYAAVTGNAVLLVGGTLVFAVLDCVLYIIARKRADRRLPRREE